ncbi:MAG: S41 family peptidase, partial [Bacteroidota bacterium]
DNYACIGGGPSTKRLVCFTERLEEGFLKYSGFRKDAEQNNYSVKGISDKIYFRKELSEDITYLKIGDFDSWYPILGDAEKFYASLENTLSKKHLIIDLRTNGGGGDRNSNILLKILKNYAPKGHLHVMINHRTGSNGEQFAHKLRNLKNSTLYGQRTMGTLAFEIKGSSHNLPCGNFVAVISSKKHAAYLEFESKGIQPDVVFTMEKDWINQVVYYINK